MVGRPIRRLDESPPRNRRPGRSRLHGGRNASPAHSGARRPPRRQGLRRQRPSPASRGSRGAGEHSSPGQSQMEALFLTLPQPQSQRYRTQVPPLERFPPRRNLLRPKRRQLPRLRRSDRQLLVIGPGPKATMHSTNRRGSNHRFGTAVSRLDQMTRNPRRQSLDGGSFIRQSVDVPARFYSFTSLGKRMAMLNQPRNAPNQPIATHQMAAQKVAACGWAATKSSFGAAPAKTVAMHMVIPLK